MWVTKNLWEKVREDLRQARANNREWDDICIDFPDGGFVNITPDEEVTIHLVYRYTLDEFQRLAEQGDPIAKKAADHLDAYYYDIDE